MEKGDNFLMDLGKEKSSRRDFMKTAGKLAAYASPTIIMLMQPSREAFAASLGHKSPPVNNSPNFAGHVGEKGGYPWWFQQFLNLFK